MNRFFLSLTLLLLIVNVNAKCGYNELSNLNNEAANVKTSYDIIKKDIGTEGIVISRTFDITILNISENIYVKITNDYDKTSKDIYYEDTNNGIYSFNWDKSNVVTNFTIDVYASNNTLCENDKLRSFYLSTPRYNDYSNRAICEEMSESSFCQEFVMFDDFSEIDFLEKVSSYKKETKKQEEPEPNNDNIIDKILKFVENNKIIIIGSIVLIIGVTSFIAYKRNKKLKEVGVK